MGERGPAPQPTALKKTKGTYRPSRDSDIDAVFPDKRPTCPAFLGDEARREWHRVVSDLHKSGLLKTVDRSTLAAYCDAYGRWVDATEQLDKSSLVLETDKGYQYPNPLVAIAANAKAEMLKAGALLGLSPSSRSRLKPEKPTDKEPSLAETLFQAVNGT
jgi:P27 family predicted phage terminase small subunit